MLKRLSQEHWPIFLLSSASSIANLFLPIILVRLLSPADVGIYKIFFLHLSAIPFLFMAGGPINSVYYWVGKDQNEKHKYLQSSWMLSLILSALVLILGVPLAHYIAPKLNLSTEYFMVLIMCGFLWCPGGHITETKIALGQTVFGSLYDTLFELLKSVGFILIAWKFKDVRLLFYTFLVILAVKFFITLFIGLKDKVIALNIDSKRLKEVFSYCLPISLSALFAFFVDKIDMLILSGYLSNEDFAFYSMGCFIVPPLFLLDMSVQKILIPKISSAYNENRKEESSLFFRKAISDISFLMIPAIFGLIFFAKPIITLLYTDQYIQSVPYLQIFALSYLLIIIPHDAIPRATGKTSWIFKIYLLTTPISLLAVFLTAKYFDAKSTLIVAIAIRFIPKILGLIYSKSIMNWKFNDMIPYKKLFLYITFSSVLTALSYLCLPLFSSELLWFLVCGGLFALIYLSVVTRFKNEWP